VGTHLTPRSEAEDSLGRDSNLGPRLLHLDVGIAINIAQSSKSYPLLMLLVQGSKE
jgi:hypothetical protein